MLQKIRYRLVHNYSGRLNRQGLAPIAAECRQGKKKIYISSKVIVSPNQWCEGKVINHVNAEKLTAYLVRWIHSIEEIELDALLKKKQLTLYQLKDSIKSGIRASASLPEFVESVINNSDRKKSTKQGYRYLVADIENYFGKVSIEDITYDFIEKYKSYLCKHKLSENTIKGKLKLLRCIVNEAIKRNIIIDDPFRFVTIGNMTARESYLTLNEVNRLEKLILTGKEKKVRDLFLLACYTGLRWSDLSTLEEAEIKNGVLHKIMKKTNNAVFIPIDTLFYGKAKNIILKYPNITELSHVCCNTTANKMIKNIAARAEIKKNVYFHIGRKTCSCLLNSFGLSLQDISAILGHRESRVTERHYLFNTSERVQTNIRKIFQNKSKNKVEEGFKSAK